MDVHLERRMSVGHAPGLLASHGQSVGCCATGLARPRHGPRSGPGRQTGRRSAARRSMPRRPLARRPLARRWPVSGRRSVGWSRRGDNDPATAAWVAVIGIIPMATGVITVTDAAADGARGAATLGEEQPGEDEHAGQESGEVSAHGCASASGLSL
jgi:hypothetical protein